MACGGQSRDSGRTATFVSPAAMRDRLAGRGLACDPYEPASIEGFHSTADPSAAMATCRIKGDTVNLVTFAGADEADAWLAAWRGVRCGGKARAPIDAVSGENWIVLGVDTDEQNRIAEALGGVKYTVRC